MVSRIPQSLTIKEFQAKFTKIVNEAVNELSFNARTTLMATHNKLFALEQEMLHQTRQNKSEEGELRTRQPNNPLSMKQVQTGSAETLNSKKITKENLKSWSKEELIDFALLRNDDAKDYSNVLTQKEEEIRELKEKAVKK